MAQGVWSRLTGFFSGDGQAAEAEGSGARRPGRTGARFMVYVPSSRDDVMRPADAMKNGSGVLVNGEYMDPAGYQQMSDFLDGAAYVLGGAGRRVSDTVRIYVPASMEIEGEAASFYGSLATGRK